MINLLPDDRKREIQAARLNVILLRYNMLVIAALGLLAVMCALFYVVLQNAQSNAVSTSNDNNSKAGSYAAVQNAANDYRNNLTIADKILTNSVNYTSFIFALTKELPAGVVLDGINLNASTFGSQNSFVARAKNYTKASELKDKFQNSKLFCNVYFQNLVDNGASAESASQYPIAITISAKVKKAVDDKC